MINYMPTETEFLTTKEDDDESVGSCSVRSGRTLTGIRHEPDNDLDEGENDNTEGDLAVFDAVDYLKHLGKMKKIPFNKSSLTDISELMVDRAEANIQKQRDKFAMDTEQNAEIIEMSIRNYSQMMIRRRERIGTLITEDTRRHTRALMDYQIEYDRLFNKVT